MMCLRTSNLPAITQSILQPKEIQTGSRTMPDRHAKKKQRVLESSSDTGGNSYRWENTPRIVLLCAGVEVLYPVLGEHSLLGRQNPYVSRIVEFLKQLLNSIPQVSVPKGSHNSYHCHLMLLNCVRCTG
jgi:hypothetical protein